MRNIKKAVDRAVNHVRNSVIGTITSVIKDNKTVFIRINEDEEIRDIKIMSPYGLFSLPMNNNMGQIIFNNTSKKASLVGVEHTSLPKEIDIGEVIIYNPNGKNYIHLKNDGEVEIAGTKVNFKKV